MSMQRDYRVVPEWTLGDRLAKARREAGYKQERLGELIGLTRQTIAILEGDKRRADRRTLIAWGIATGVDFDWLIGTPGQPGPDGGNTRRYGPEACPSPARHLAAVAA